MYFFLTAIPLLLLVPSSSGGISPRWGAQSERALGGQGGREENAARGSCLLCSLCSSFLGCLAEFCSLISRSGPKPCFVPGVEIPNPQRQARSLFFPGARSFPRSCGSRVLYDSRDASASPVPACAPRVSPVSLPPGPSPPPPGIALLPCTAGASPGNTSSPPQ